MEGKHALIKFEDIMESVTAPCMLTEGSLTQGKHRKSMLRTSCYFLKVTEIMRDR